MKAALFRNLSDKPSSSSNAGDMHSPSGVDVRMFQHGNKNNFFSVKDDLSLLVIRTFIQKWQKVTAIV